MEKQWKDRHTDPCTNTHTEKLGEHSDKMVPTAAATITPAGLLYTTQGMVLASLVKRLQGKLP